MYRKKLRLAYTLCEILLLISIIGIISEFTIPVVIQNIQEQSTITKLKKSYNTLQQAVNIITNEYGSIKNSPMSGDLGNGSHEGALGDVFKPHFKHYAYYGSAGTLYNRPVKNLDNTIFSTKSIANTVGSPTFLFNNESVITLMPWSSKCSSPCDGTPNVCSIAIIDINGVKNPNTYGRDIFKLFITPAGVKPSGANISNENSDCNILNKGYQCAGIVLLNNSLNYLE